MATVHVGMGLAPMFMPGELNMKSHQSPTFAEKFNAQSAQAGANRTLVEKRSLACRSVAAKDWDAALDAFHECAELSVELQDQSGEAQAVLGMADCLSQKDEVDEELILGMYSHVVKCAEAADDTNTLFHAYAGSASLKRALRKPQEAEQSLQKALDTALLANNAKQAGYAYTQLAFLLMDKLNDVGTTSGVETVNQDKENVHFSPDADTADEKLTLTLGASPTLKQALKYLQEAKSSIHEVDHTPEEMATPCMNLAMAFIRVGGTTNKRKASLEMKQAFAALQSVSETDPRFVQIARTIAEFHEENPWIADTDADIAALAKTCQEKVTRAGATRPPSDNLAASCSREERVEKERLRWAEEKLAAMRAAQLENSDSEDDEGPVRPKFEGWERE